MSVKEDNALSMRWRISRTLRARAPFLDEKYSEDLAGAIMEDLRREFGGDEIYLPAPDKTARDDDIKRRWSGRNADEICEEYRISRRRLYQILGKSRR